MKENVKEVENNVDEQKQEGQLVMVNRVFKVDTEFNMKLAREFCDFVDEIVEFDELFKEQYPDEELAPVYIYISSNGGECQALSTMLDAMDDIKAPIIGIVRGMAFSCAFWLLVRCDIRLCGRFSRLMWHQIAYGIDGKLVDHNETYEESVKMQDNYDKMVLERTKITKKQLEKYKKTKTDFYMDKDEALKLGVVNFAGSLDDLFAEQNKDDDEQGAE